MKNMKKYGLFFIVISISTLLLSSCATQRMARFYVENKTKKEVTNFQITWETDDGSDSIIIEKISPKSETDYYAVFLKTVAIDVGQDAESEFYITYEKDGKDFDFTNSKTLKTKLNGEAWDPEAKFIADETYCIEITDDEYSIKLKK